MRTNIFILLILLSTITRAGTYHPAIDYIFPLPDSKLLPVKATVILKLDESYNDQITDLSELIVVKDDGIVRGGNTFFAAGNRTIIFKPDNDFQRGKTITVTVQLSQFGFDDFQYIFTIAKSSGNDLDLPNKRNAAVRASISDVQKLSPVRLINGVAVPSDFPEIHVNIIGETAPGRIFIPANNWIIICNNDGTPYFYRKYKDGYEKMRFDAHPSGVLSFHCFEVYDVILDQNFVEIDTVYPGHGYLPDDHELQILANGHMLLVARDDARIDMSKIVSGGNTNALVEAHHVQELDQDHNVIFEWRNWDHLDIRETQVPLQGGFIDFVHTNSIAVDYDGHYIISPREYNMIMKIDGISGETIWKLGGKNSDFTFINEDIEFSRIHDVRPVPGKPNQYTLFDNGRDRADGTQFSRAVEYKLDLDAMTAEKVWEYRHNPDLYSSFCGSTQPLMNGNRLIGWAGNNYFTEVNSSGDLVYEMYISSFSCSRCRRYEWEGMMLQPYLILENMGTIIRLVFNKFGDPGVDYYNIYAGVSANSLALFDTTKQTYYDIDANLLENGSQYFFRVTAVNTGGNESGYSNEEEVFVNIIKPGSNLLFNGDFSEGLVFWTFSRTGSASAVGGVKSGEFDFYILDGGSELPNVQLYQDNITLIQGQDYTFEFDAYADAARAIEAKVGKASDPWTNYSKIGMTALTTEKKRYRYTFTMEDPSDQDCRVVINCGTSDIDVYLDNVVFSLGVPNGVETTVSEELLSQRYSLNGNYPNPFNNSTKIQLTLPFTSHIKLKVYDINGRFIKTIINRVMAAGDHEVFFEAENMSSGIYFVQLQIADQIFDTRKMVYLK